MTGMNRREVVKLGVLGVAAGCVGWGGGGDDAPVDAPMANGGFEMCGADNCVSLMDPANAALLVVNGVRAVNIPDKIIIVRKTETEFAVLSRVCTHNGCGVGYQSASMSFSCPCHGSRFSIDGAVTIAIVVIEIGDGIATTTGIAVAVMIGTIAMTATIGMVVTGTMVATTTPLRLS
jgi:cytochrome b6-f complex iron-sulfur subunit